MTTARGVLLVLAVVIAAGLVGRWVLAGQGVDLAATYDVRATVPEAPGLRTGPGTEVTVAGVRVGHVGAVALREGRADLRLVLRRDRLPVVRGGTEVVLRPQSPLGDVAVDLAPGNGPPLQDGDRLPDAAGRAPNDLDTLLSGLGPDSRRWLQLVAAEGARAADDGAALRRLVQAGRPASQRLAAITAELRSRRARIKRLAADGRVLAQAVAAGDADLRRGIDALTSTSEAVAPHGRAVAAAARGLAVTLDDLRSATRASAHLAARLRGAEPELRRVLAATPAAARATAPVLRQTSELLRDELRPLVRTGAPAAGDGARAAAATRASSAPAARALGVAGTALDALARNPAGQEEGSLRWLAWAVHNAGSAASTQDANGASLRGLLVATCAAYAGIAKVEPTLVAMLPQPECPA